MGGNTSDGSAFYTLQPYLLLTMLNNMGVNSNIIRGINSFISGRPQFVTVNGIQSPITHTDTGAPQGCVISPILFILYNNQSRCITPDYLMIKFADDTVLAGFISPKFNLALLISKNARVYGKLTLDLCRITNFDFLTLT